MTCCDSSVFNRLRLCLSARRHRATAVQSVRGRLARANRDPGQAAARPEEHAAPASRQVRAGHRGGVRGEEHQLRERPACRLPAPRRHHPHHVRQDEVFRPAHRSEEAQPRCAALAPSTDTGNRRQAINMVAHVAPSCFFWHRALQLDDISACSKATTFLPCIHVLL